MSTTQIRQHLHEFIRFADEKKVKAIYTMIEDEIKDKHAVWEAFYIKELKRRSDELVSGKVERVPRSHVTKKVLSLLKK